MSHCGEPHRQALHPRFVQAADRRKVALFKHSHKIDTEHPIHSILVMAAIGDEFDSIGCILSSISIGRIACHRKLSCGYDESQECPLSSVLISWSFACS